MPTFHRLLLGSFLLLAACASQRDLPVAGRGSVAIGMTHDEVEKALGEPDSRSQIDERSMGWIYWHDKPERPDGLLESSEVEFDAAGRVKAVVPILAGVGQ